MEMSMPYIWVVKSSFRDEVLKRYDTKEFAFSSHQKAVAFVKKQAKGRLVKNEGGYTYFDTGSGCAYYLDRIEFNKVA